MDTAKVRLQCAVYEKQIGNGLVLQPVGIAPCDAQLLTKGTTVLDELGLGAPRIEGDSCGMSGHLNATVRIRRQMLLLRGA